MWRNIIRLEEPMLTKFENKFKFNFQEDLRGFILDHNGGTRTPAPFPTAERERKLTRLLDFSNPESSTGAWTLNQRLSSQLGDKRIIIGADQKGNFICVQRHLKQQSIVLWSHVSGDFEDCLLDIPAFLRAIS